MIHNGMISYAADDRIFSDVAEHSLEATRGVGTNVPGEAVAQQAPLLRYNKAFRTSTCARSHSVSFKQSVIFDSIPNGRVINMRLIHARTFALEEFFNAATPPYAILSHTWETEEVSLSDMTNLEAAKLKRGFLKIQYTCNQARRDGLQYAWVDTCCIDKRSSAELQEAINSSEHTFVPLSVKPKLTAHAR